MRHGGFASFKEIDGRREEFSEPGACEEIPQMPQLIRGLCVFV
jgi:hypothetical protein